MIEAADYLYAHGESILVCGLAAIFVVFVLCYAAAKDEGRKNDIGSYWFISSVGWLILFGIVVCFAVRDTSIRYKHETFTHLATRQRSEWGMETVYSKVQNIDGKTFVRLGNFTYLAEKKEDGSVFLYKQNGDLRYGIAPNGDAWDTDGCGCK